MLYRLAQVGVVLLFVVFAFAYTGEWLSPNTLTPDKFIDGFEEVNGPHPGFRRFVFL